MTERSPFEHEPALAGGGSLSCEAWEVLLAEAVDGLLPSEARPPFEAHSAECRVCSQLLKQSQQGREWLHFLEDEPAVPAGMMDRILGKTSGSVAVGQLAVGGGVASHLPVHLLGVPLRRSMWDSRMMMTAAMAFFSLALTLNVALNLAGVRVTNLRLADLTPASMEMNLTQQFYGAKKSVVQYYDNLRLVYEVESKMRDLRRNEEMQQSTPQQQQQTVPANPPGNGHKNGGKLEPSTVLPQTGTFWGAPQLASATGAMAGVFNGQAEDSEQEGREKNGDEVGSIAVLCERVQAERSLA
ncbi:MAG TPA: hypothetical protein VGT04_12990 [Acidobacteriaceae bacterium]|nr:hypothetical protein [Acidobacteriaceae bacterium]